MLKNLKLNRLELLCLAVMMVCLLASLAALLLGKKENSQVAIAIERVQTLYQNGILQFYSTKEFSYSLTRISSNADFFAAKPPGSKPEILVGYSGDAKNRRGKGETFFSAWERIGFPLNAPSYYVYRVEPEYAYTLLAKPGDQKSQYYHFRALAIGDTDGDGHYSIFSRGGYLSKDGFFKGQEQLLTLAMEE